LALWLKANKFRLDQVQNFLPTPMTLATCMYHTAKNPLQPRKVSSDPTTVPEYASIHIPKSSKTRQFHKALLRYHDPKNWPFIRRELRRMHREDLIGSGKHHLVPYW
jgi:radical SAM superfamily enzyme YgiQ (UPF0313 family)